MLRIWRIATLASFVWLALYLAIALALGLNFGEPATEVLRSKLNRPDVYFQAVVSSGGGLMGPAIVARFQSNPKILSTLIHGQNLEPTTNLECRQRIAQNLPFFLLWGPHNAAHWRCRVGFGKTQTIYLLYQSGEPFVYVYLSNEGLSPNSADAAISTSLGQP